MSTSLSFKNLISASQITINDIHLLIEYAKLIKVNNKQTNKVYDVPMVLASLFFESSTIETGPSFSIDTFM